jgi:DNA-binding transcriptional MerR regulator
MRRDENGMLMKIGELAKQSGLSAHTIRYYERIGLLPFADRDQSGQRDYDASILVWIEILGRLKTTGMPIQNMLRYAALRDLGGSTEKERHDLLVTHRPRFVLRWPNCKPAFSSLRQKLLATPAQ